MAAFKIAIVSFFFFVFAAVLRQTHVDPAYQTRKARPSISEDVLRSPGEAALQLTALEHRHAWADVFWLMIVQDLGRCVVEKREGRPCHMTDADYDRLQRWAHITTDLDPLYFVAYYASAIHLAVWGKRPDAADELLLKGRVALPTKWELNFTLGYNAYFLRGDAMQAAEYWELAALIPDAPRYLPSLAARARHQSGDEAGAIAILEAMLEYLTGAARLDAEIRLKLLHSEKILRLYDEACQNYQASFGQVPEAAVLHQAGKVGPSPFDLLGNPIKLDENCRARTKDIHVREDEALDRIGSQSRESEGTYDVK